jgi:hypothetical protein
MAVVYTDQQLADEWQMPVSTLQDMLRDGRVHGFKVGRAWRITEAARLEYEQGVAS